MHSLLTRKSETLRQKHTFYCLGLGIRIGKLSATFLNLRQIVEIIWHRFSSENRKINLKFSFLEPDIKLSKWLSKEFRSSLKTEAPSKKQSTLERIIKFSYMSSQNSALNRSVLLDECIR